MTQCTHCSQAFQITDADLAFYEKVSPVFNGKKELIPPPTHCPECRQQRRFTWRNERTLYHRKCDATGKTVISNFSSNADLVVYEQNEWWSDHWESKKYGQEFDFSRPFFEQFAALQKNVPQQALCISRCENCDYCNYSGDNKNCYLTYGSVYCEDCLYGSPYYSKNCVDSLVIRNCELCYECIDCRRLHTCFYCQDCWNSDNLLYCYDVHGCSECIGCAGLRNKKFCIFNVQYTESEYKSMKQELNLCIPQVQHKLASELQRLKLDIPHCYMQSSKTENSTGNYIYESKNIHSSFYADKSEDCKYCMQVVELKDCHDNNYTEENELCYDYLGMYIVDRSCFSKFLVQTSNCLYSDACKSSKNLFGCIAMRQSEYCILNKQYTKEEYETLVPKIIEHMRRTGEWGEFFPVVLSPFGYNETVAQEYFPLTKQEVETKGWFWREEEENEKKYMGPVVDVPSNIQAVDASLCEQILQCQESGRLFRIIEQELQFYKEMNVPIPKYCPDARHRMRLDMRNPRKLWDRMCDKCKKQIRSSYRPERNEMVYCEECYLEKMY